MVIDYVIIQDRIPSGRLPCQNNIGVKLFASHIGRVVHYPELDFVQMGPFKLYNRPLQTGV